MYIEKKADKTMLIKQATGTKQHTTEKLALLKKTAHANFTMPYKHHSVCMFIAEYIYIYS